ncbi:MAG: BLUF domain-containing protein [Acetobacteraceae bacterium]|nr:BLUF domain-containing protein [Acetobacteraceae bacterium]
MTGLRSHPVSDDVAKGGAGGHTRSTTPAARVPDALLRLHRLAYVSRSTATSRQARAQALGIAEHARRANLRLGLTGALVCGAGVFGQVLEGPLGPLTAVFDRILSDPRHHDVRLLILEPASHRGFADWGMIYSGELPGRLLRAAWAGYARRERDGDAAAAEQASTALTRAIQAAAERAGARKAPRPWLAPRPAFQDAMARHA